MSEVSLGLALRRLWMLPYTWLFASALNNSSSRVIMPQGHIPASMPAWKAISSFDLQLCQINIVHVYVDVCTLTVHVSWITCCAMVKSFLAFCRVAAQIPHIIIMGCKCTTCINYTCSLNIHIVAPFLYYMDMCIHVHDTFCEISWPPWALPFALLSITCTCTCVYIILCVQV